MKLIPLTTAAALAAVAVTSVAAQKPPSFQSLDLVDLDVVVTDRDGRAVSGLTRQDFEVREDGKAVELKAFVAVSARGSANLDDGRSVVVLLDDVGMRPAATSSIRSIAGHVAAHAGPGDDLTVIRLANRNDEPYGDRSLALARIVEYQAGVGPFDRVRTSEDVLRLVTSVSRSLELTARRRKAIVCIGSQAICNIREPRPYAVGSLRRDWIEAVGAAARANVSMYALLANRVGLSSGGIVEATGGEVFTSARDLRPAIERIWQDASHHYLLGYWPVTSRKELHSMEVKVARKGLRVLARRQRGN
ncbi:MAG: hypothetical protein A3H97_24780 [Acidobacteria bacterium RIFCSPLOWO2_02_FULL_65_29]|nr:MAG: hypothetical protein A3H97_24780 [Acidobacteria bacterium RIFCSPLOWO2_02_FULL_65_29]